MEMDTSLLVSIGIFYLCVSLFIGYTFPIIKLKLSRDSEHALSILLSLFLPIFLILRVTYGGYRIPWTNETPNDSACTIFFNVLLVVLIFPIPFQLLMTPSIGYDYEVAGYK